VRSGTAAAGGGGGRAAVYSVAGAIDFNLDSTDEIDLGTFDGYGGPD
jgi:hypothetical protein